MGVGWLVMWFCVLDCGCFILCLVLSWCLMWVVGGFGCNRELFFVVLLCFVVVFV